MTYEINYSDGRSAEAETYEDACNMVRAAYPEAEIGHPGDLKDGGDRTLCWASEDDARDDDGQRAIAMIRPRKRPVTE